MIQNVWGYLQLTTFCITSEAPNSSNSAPLSGSYAVQTTWVIASFAPKPRLTFLQYS